MTVKEQWNSFSNRLGPTVLHPQFFAKRGEYVMVELIAKTKPAVYLDIGCGSQPHRAAIKPYVSKYIALDHPRNIAYYRSNYPVDLVSDASHISLPDRSIDAVSMFWVIEHLKNPDLVLREVARVLKPGGHLYIYFVENYPAHGYPPNYQRFTREGMRLLLNKSGLIATRFLSFGNLVEFVVTTCNVAIMEWVKKLLSTRWWQIVGWVALMGVYPFLVVANLFGLLCGWGRVAQPFIIGHVVIARRSKAS